MSPNIFLIDDDRGLVEMREQRYDSESLLQTLLADYPALLAGESGAMGDGPVRMLLVRREASIGEERDGPGRWSLDHLFLDAAGVPTLVEVKRSTDTRIRREMIGQMLDYAAHAVTTWTDASVAADFEATCTASGREPSDVLGEMLGDAADEEAFWANVRRNLEAGRVRMVFVADAIPREVRRVVEFLNEQMSPAEVLAIEVKQFLDPVHGMRTLVPQVVGQSVKSLDRKSDPGPREPKREWDEVTVLADLAARRGADDAKVAERVIHAVRAMGLEEGFVGGPKQGSLYFVVDAAPEPVRFVYVHSTGVLGFGFGRLAKATPFADTPARLEVARILERIPGMRVKNIDGGPTVPFAVLQDPVAFEVVLEAVEFVVVRCRDEGASGSARQGAREPA